MFIFIIFRRLSVFGFRAEGLVPTPLGVFLRSALEPGAPLPHVGIHRSAIDRLGAEPPPLVGLARGALFPRGSAHASSRPPPPWAGWGWVKTPIPPYQRDETDRRF